MQTKTDSIKFNDTLYNIVTDSFFHNLGNIPMVNNTLVKYFKYIGNDPVNIIRNWTTDPHYICQYPTEVLLKDHIYSISICFWNEGSPGKFTKAMGFNLSNGKEIKFVFSGNVLPKD